MILIFLHHLLGLTILNINYWMGCGWCINWVVFYMWAFVRKGNFGKHQAKFLSLYYQIVIWCNSYVLFQHLDETRGIIYSLACNNILIVCLFIQKPVHVDEAIMADIWRYLSFYFWYRRLVKFLLHFSTGQCELQRICYKTRHGALRTGQVGRPIKTDIAFILQLQITVND